jgi:hypothetical protein
MTESEWFSGVWDSSRQILVLTTLQETTAGENIMLEFAVVNPCCSQSSPRVYIEASGIAISQTPMDPDVTTQIKTKDDEGAAIDANPGWAAPLAIFKGRLYARSVQQSTSTPATENMLTITFKSTVPLSSRAALLINGLNGMRLADGSLSGFFQGASVSSGAELQIQTGQQSCFVPVAELPASGDCATSKRAMRCPYLDASTPHAPKLLIGINTISAHTDIQVTVTFKNADQAQDCQNLSIATVSCEACYNFMPLPLLVPLLKLTSNECPLTIVPSAKFEKAEICQSQGCAGAVNTFTATLKLQAGEALTGGKNSEVTIRGLRGSTTLDSIITLLEGTPVFESTARWVQNSGMLILRVANKATFDSEQVVKFDLMNPKYKQAAASLVEVSASGDKRYEPARMTTTSCSAANAPMKISAATFTDVSVSATSEVGGADNVITVKFKPSSCAVLCDTRNSVITIEGLVGAATKDTMLMPITMVTGDKGLFMSANNISLSFSRTCALEDNKVVIAIAGVPASADLTGTMLHFSDGACSGRYTRIKEYVIKSGCASLETLEGKWSDVKDACEIGSVAAIPVRQRGSGYISGDFVVVSETESTGSGLTGRCVVSADGGVDSIVVNTPGKGYNKNTKIRCRRACPMEEAQVAACGMDMTTWANMTSAQKAACGAPINDFGGMISVTTLANEGPKITSVCSWTRSAGRLTCAVQSCVDTTDVTEFTLTLENARVNQACNAVNIMTSGQVAIPAVQLGKAMRIATISPGDTSVEVSITTTNTGFEGKENDIKTAVAAAAGVEISEVAIEKLNKSDVTIFTRSSSYLRPAEENKLRFKASVKAVDPDAASFIATGLTSERINAQLRSISNIKAEWLPIEVSEEDRAAVVEVAKESVTASCICVAAVVDQVAKTCTCDVEFKNLPVPNKKTYSLSVKVQCNSAQTVNLKHEGAAEGEYIWGIKPDTALAKLPVTCTDKCGAYHNLVTNELDQAMKDKIVAGSLKLQMVVQGLQQDYCGAGDLFKSVLVLSYSDDAGQVLISLFSRSLSRALSLSHTLSLSGARALSLGCFS